LTASAQSAARCRSQADNAIYRAKRHFATDTQALGFNGVGRGIGLAAVRALVEAHGGKVRAFSDGSMQGSRFVVTLALPGGALAVQAGTPTGGP